MRAPTALSVTITPADPSLDMTTVTAVVLRMRRADGTTATLAATIQAGATAASLVANYTFASDGSDLTVPGDYRFDPLLTVPGGFVDGTTIPEVAAPAYFFFR
jgi:hypothetical protein